MSDDSSKREGFDRRQFIISGAAALGGVAASGLPALGAQVNPEKRVLHIMGYSHIDAAWLWPWRDGSNLALTTFRSALDRMKETPDFRYTHSSSHHYVWVERADPRMFEEVKERVKEGRWEVVGGWPVEPDCNVPSAESFVRHSLYSKDYFRRAFGVEVNIGFNPDAFGHAAGLPGLLRRAGFRYYVFMRPQEHEMKLPLLFWWEGPDGSRLLTLRIRRGYSMNAERIGDGAQNNFAPGFDHAAYFLGVGNHGGGATKEQIRRVIEQRTDATLPELRFSTVAAFFAAVEKSPAFAELPVVRGDRSFSNNNLAGTNAAFINNCVRRLDGTTTRFVTNAAGARVQEPCTNPAFALRNTNNTLRTSPLRLGNLREPSATTFDMSLNKSFNFTESVRFQFRVELFNAFNTPLFGSPDTGDATSQTFGVLNPNNGQRNIPRQIQLGFKFNF